MKGRGGRTLEIFFIDKKFFGGQKYVLLDRNQGPEIVVFIFTSLHPLYFVQSCIAGKYVNISIVYICRLIYNKRLNWAKWSNIILLHNQIKIVIDFPQFVQSITIIKHTRRTTSDETTTFNTPNFLINIVSIYMNKSLLILMMLQCIFLKKLTTWGNKYIPILFVSSNTQNFEK